MDTLKPSPQAGRRGVLRLGLQALVALMLPRWGRAAVPEAAANGVWPEASFTAETLPEAIATLTQAEVVNSAELRIDAPALAENGAVVPVKIELDAPADQVAILVAGNPVPMVARFDLSPAVRGPIATRIKMGESSNITVLALEAGKARRQDRPVEVTVGGCG